MDPTDIRYILDDLACNASQEALQELYMLYYKRIARYIGLYVRYDGAGYGTDFRCVLRGLGEPS